MLTKKSIFLAILFTLSMIMVACSSQEYTTAKLAIQQSDFAKAAEWLPKAMAVEPDNPEIPVVLGLEIHVYGPETHVTDIVRMALEDEKK